jgi:hypothetical protein
MILGWMTGASSANSIDIDNMTKYFVVSNSLVVNGVGYHDGIYPYNVANKRGENGTCLRQFEWY